MTRRAVQVASAHQTGRGQGARIISFGKGRFRPRARLIRTIGAELISSEVVAVLELVRNAYDADARRCEIRFSDPHAPEASIEIVDDGHGMGREVLLGPWLEPATDHKATGSGRQTLGGDRSPKGRRRLGSKGVGRFAAQRLGHKLTVRTSTGGRQQLEADFDWEHLDRPDKYLDELRIPWREMRAPRKKWHGTSLVITNLRDRWTSARFERLRLALRRLVGPGLGDDPFEINLFVQGVPDTIRPAIESLVPMYSIAGTVEAPGTASITYRDLLGTKEQWTRSVLWPGNNSGCGAFKFKINAWDLDREAFQVFLDRTESKVGPRDFRRTIRDHSGVSLYRDGFRILPYGEPDNDWLRLDRRRVNNPTLRLSNNQILGYIAITGDGNPLLQDQTNREGLVTNEAYTHLQHVLLELLSYLETRRFATRRSTEFTSTRTKSLLPPVQSAEADGHVDELFKRLERRGASTTGDIEALRNAVQAQREQAARSVRQYSSLAATGQLAALVFTRLSHPLRQVRTEMSLLDAEVARIEMGTTDREDLQATVSRLMRRTTDLQAIMDRLDPIARPRSGRKLGLVDLERCITDVIAAFSDEIGRREVDVRLTSDGTQSVVGDLCVIEQILAILLENALHWVCRGPAPRVVRIVRAGVGFSIWNSGPAVPASQVETIFAPHFTTREEASGMGLTLARDLLEGVGASIRCLVSRKGAAFEVTLPAPS